jgi:guanylate kinase
MERMILILAGASASGKSTCAKMINDDNRNDIKQVITYTTRKPRENEQDCVDYHFVTDEQFNRMKDNNEFFEYVTYKNWQYGTKIDMNPMLNQVVVLNPTGVRAFKKYNEYYHTDMVIVYLNVDRRSRLIKMLERGDDIEEAYRRCTSDEGQFAGFEREVNYVIENDRYKLSPEEVVNLIYNHALNGETHNMEVSNESN